MEDAIPPDNGAIHMNKRNNTLFTLLALGIISCATQSHAGAGHGAAEGQESKIYFDEDTHEMHITVTKEQVTRLGIQVSEAVKGQVNREISVPAEITMNSDKAAHVVPRAAGIVREVTKSIGDSVKAGEVLAWIESDELADAKLNYYEKQTEVGCCEIELPRAQEIFANVAKLIDILKKEATEEQIGKLHDKEMGSYRGKLLTAYTGYQSAKITYEREKSLHTKNIGSGQELQIAETKMRQARAGFHAAMDTARYETLIAYSEAIQDRQVAEFNVVAAEKQLRLKGADDALIAELDALIPKTASLKPCLCDDPDCGKTIIPSVAATLGKNKRFAWNALRAPFDGTVTARHIVMGESVDTSSEAFMIADLSSVWVDLSISRDHIPVAKKGQTVTLYMPGDTTTSSEIEYISPTLSRETRTATARLSIDNPEGLFKPGMFIEAGIHIPSPKDAVVVPQDSVQLVNDQLCVFVWGKSDFILRAVETGMSNGELIEITKGLKEGEQVVSVNAFSLKAEATKSDTGSSCSGHSH